MLRPGFLRGAMGFGIGIVISVILYIIIRVLVGLPVDATPGTAAQPNTLNGAILMFAGFGGAIGWLWGVGSFAPGSGSHEGPVAHYNAQERGTSALVVARDRTLKAMPHLIESLKPMIKPLLIALGISAAVVILFVLAGSVLPTRIQTSNPDASVAAITGDKTPKAVIFLIVVVVVLGLLAGMAIGIGLLMSWLTREVEVAKKSPNNPPPIQPKLFRIINFFMAWVNDILEGTRRSIMR
jgi:hypothetical protein